MPRTLNSFLVRHKARLLVALYFIIFFVLPWFFFMGQEDLDTTLFTGGE
jgi:hypothetical protein